VASWIEKNIEQPILLVENNQDDILLILRAFQRAGVTRRIQAVTSGMDAVAYLQGTPPYGDREKYPLPAVILFDIKMPGMDGFQVLAWIRRQWEFFQLCVVMLTSSDHIRDVNEAYHLGANSFLVKPLDFENAASWRARSTRFSKRCSVTLQSRLCGHAASTAGGSTTLPVEAFSYVGAYPM
jgi:CheY-like chemotaxis protein